MLRCSVISLKSVVITLEVITNPRGWLWDVSISLSTEIQQRKTCCIVPFRLSHWPISRLLHKVNLNAESESMPSQTFEWGYWGGRGCSIATTSSHILRKELSSSKLDLISIVTYAGSTLYASSTRTKVDNQVQIQLVDSIVYQSRCLESGASTEERWFCDGSSKAARLESMNLKEIWKEIWTQPLLSQDRYPYTY